MRYFFILALCWLVSTDAIACDCNPRLMEDPVASAEASDVIFVGTVIETTDEAPEKQLRFAEVTVTFELEKAWKNPPLRQHINIISRSKCDAHFFLGETYLVFATGDGKKGYYEASKCSSTGLVDKRRHDLEVLGEPHKVYE